jgi:Ser/Thr protein kinase RdoA (MazF antagonist)
VVRLVQKEAWRLAAEWPRSNLVHADYKPWNLLVRRSASGWALSAALDWEFTFAGPPLCDFGVFLRYGERMPAAYQAGFLDGYRAGGGSLPADVRNLARLIDLVSLWTFLERAPVDPAIVRDVTPLLVATVEAFAQ